MASATEHGFCMRYSKREDMTNGKGLPIQRADMPWVLWASCLTWFRDYGVDVFYGTPSWLDEVERKFQDRSDAIFDRMQRILQEHKVFLGSVSDYAAHHADCPVLIVKPHEKPHEHAKSDVPVTEKLANVVQFAS